MRASLVLFISAVAAGCGSGGSETYAMEPTAACLRESGATEVSTNEDDMDYIAAAAREGAVRADVNGAEVHVVFGRNANDAVDILAAYEIVAVQTGHKLLRKGNAVLAWSSTPTDEEREIVERCLSK